MKSVTKNFARGSGARLGKPFRLPRVGTELRPGAHHASQAIRLTDVLERAVVVTVVETTSSYDHHRDERTEHKMIGGLHRT